MIPDDPGHFVFFSFSIGMHFFLQLLNRSLCLKGTLKEPHCVSYVSLIFGWGPKSNAGSTTLLHLMEKAWCFARLKFCQRTVPQPERFSQHPHDHRDVGSR